MALDPKTKKPTRIGHSIDAKTGTKKRVAKVSGEILTKVTVKGTKTKKDKGAAVPAADGAKAPAKQPFWKRGGGKGEDGAKVDESKTGGAAALPMAHRSQGG
jgi:hypothetical protein